jgi:hypothetical protein
MARRGVDEQLGADVRALVAALGRVRSPRSRLIAATALLESLRGAERMVLRVRDQAVCALAQAGTSYAQLGELAGLTRGRVAQIVQDLAAPQARGGAAADGA